MPEVKAEIKLNAHREWENCLKIDGSYEQVKEQIDLFYEIAKTCMEMAIKREETYHEGVAKHFRQ